MRAGVRPRSRASAILAAACIGIAVTAVGGSTGGGSPVDTRLWGGLLVTLVVSVTGTSPSMPVGMRWRSDDRSTISIRVLFRVAFIEFCAACR